MNRMSHWRQPRAAQQQMARVKDQGALWRQAKRTDESKRLGEKTTAKPITEEPGQ